MIDNYYILSLPQFVWTRAPSLAEPITVSRCDRLGTHRMVITVGLREPEVECVPLLKILDLSTGTMISTFADTVEYAVPGYVVADIGGEYVMSTPPPPNPVCALSSLTDCSGAGGANVTRPAGGYVDGLEAVIGATPLPDPPAPSCANGEQHDCGRSHRGAIAGGAVGAGVVALGLVWLWLRRRRRRVGSEDTDTECVGPQMHELMDPGPELQSRDDAMLTSAHELPMPVVELQSREDGMLTSAHEMPGDFHRV